MNRSEYMQSLSVELDKLGLNAIEKAEILEDFGTHFTDGAAEGLTEPQICDKLGDIREIAKQYVPNHEGVFESAKSAASEITGQPSGREYSQSPKSGFSLGGVIGIIGVDILVFSWVIPVLFSLVVAYFAVAYSLILAGLTVMICSVFLPFVVLTSFSMLSAFLLGVSILSFGGLTALLSVKVIKGFLSAIKSFVNLHSRWVIGRNIFNKRSVHA
jgi:uncharacterized membrane protein